MDTCWREELIRALANHGETWADIEAITLTQEGLDRRFDDGYGAVEGQPFTAWTAKRVYFPVTYDGSEYAESVSRHPDGQPTQRVGG